MRWASSTSASSPRTARACGRAAGRCATTTRWSTTSTDPRPARRDEAGGLALRLASLGRQSLVYGLGTVVSRFASLLLLPVYTHYLTHAELGSVQLAVAYVAVAATVAQLGMVNAVFRFAVERRGDERWAVVRSAIAFCAVSGAVVTALSLAATPWGAQWVGSRPLWIVTCAGLWISLLYEPMVGLYRVEQRPQRYVAITVVNVAITVVASVAAVTVFSFGAAGLLAGSFTGTALALGLVALDRRREVFGHVDRALLRPMLRFGLPFVPSRLALWGLTWATVVLLAALDSRSAAGVFSVAYRVAQVVALLVTAFQLAWPPFAYSIHDDDEARRVYRAVLTYWLLLSLWAVLGLALLRDPIMRALPGGYEAAAGPMAVYALGLAFYGAYYVVAVAVGRVKKTGFNWVATGTAAAVSVALCLVLIPRYGVMGGAVAPCLAYALMAAMMTVRAQQVFPVGYEWARVCRLLIVAGALFAVADRVLAQAGAAAVAARLAVALSFPLVLYATRFFGPEERRRLRLMARRPAAPSATPPR